MKVATFSPYGTLHKEAGVLYLLANYLAKSGVEVSQARCDGAVSACGRDRGQGVVRTPFQCARCLNEQRALSTWAGVRCHDLSAEISPDDARKVAEWLQSVPRDALTKAEFRGENLWTVCGAEVRSRWDDFDPSVLSASQEADVRELYSSYVTTSLATERFVARWSPSVAFVTTPQDPLVYACVVEMRRANIDVAVFRYNPESESISIQYIPTGEVYETALMLEGITSMRGDPRTWSPEISSLVHELSTFLGCAPDKVV